MTTTSLNLDVWLAKNVYVKANQGEVNSRFLEITLTDKSVPLNITGKTVIFYATKPDKNIIYNLCTVENAEDGVISVCLTSQMSAVAGKMPCEIHIIDRDKATLKAVGLELEIVKCANVDEAVESTSEFTALQEAMAEYDRDSEEIDTHVANKNNPHEVTAAQIGAASSNHTHNFSSLGNKPTTLSGYGINDAVSSSRTINSKALSSDITLNYTDVGASSSTHTHNFSEIQSKPTTLGGYGITDAIPASRTVNSKVLSSDITLDYTDVGAASSTDVGTVANLNTTDKTVVGAINEVYELGGGTSVISVGKGGTGATTASAALSNLGGVPNTRTINGAALSSDITLTASNVGAVPTSRTVNSKALSSNITLSASDVGAAASSHNHSASDITSGTLPISRGGTGSTTGTAALKNLGIIDLIYPVGSIYMSVNSTSPATLFGGTWSRWGNGRVPVGVNTSDSNFSTVEKTGGESTHTLTVNEMPSHRHGSRVQYPCGNTGTAFKHGDQSDVYIGIDSGEDNTIQPAGGGQAHNNLQPYITCYMWKRTA